MKLRPVTRRALYALAVLIAALAGGPLLIPRAWLGEMLAARIESALTVPVQIDGARLWPLSGATLTGLRLGPPPGFDCDPVRVDRVEVEYVPWSLVAGRLRVVRLALEGVDVCVERATDGAWNLARLTPTDPDPPPRSTETFSMPLPVRIDAAEISPLHVEVRTPTSSGRSGPLALELEGKAEGSLLEASARLAARPRASDAVSWGPPASPQLGADARPPARVRITGGSTLTASARYDTRRPWTQLEAEFDWQHAFTVAAPALGPAVQTHAELRGRLDPDADVAHLRIERFTVGETTRFDATARLGAWSAWSATSTAAARAGTLDVETHGVIDVADAMRLPGVRTASGRVELQGLSASARGLPAGLQPVGGRGALLAQRLEVATPEVRLRLDRAELTLEGETSGLRAQVALEGGGVDATAARLEGIDLRLGARVSPRPLDLSVDGVVTATLALGQARGAGVDVDDLIATLGVQARRYDGGVGHERLGLDFGARARGATYDAGVVDELEVQARVQSSEDAERVTVEGEVRAARGAAAGVEVEGLRANVDGGATAGTLQDLEARLGLEAGRASGFHIGSTQVQAYASPRSGASRSLGPVALARRIRALVEARSEGLWTDVDGERFSTGALDLDAEGEVDLGSSIVRDGRVRLDAGIGAKAQAELSGGATGPAQAQLSVEVPSLGPTYSALPSAWRLPDVELAGFAVAEARVRWPEGASLEDRDTARGALALTLRGVGYQGPGLRVAGLDGRSHARYDGPQSAELGWRLQAAELESDVAGSAQGLTATGTATLDVEGARLRASVRGAEGRAAAGLGLADARVEVDVRHPRGRGVELRAARLALPEAGVYASVDGALESGAYGTLQPRLSVSATVAPARLAEVSSILASSAGVSTARITVEPTSRSAWRVYGEVGADGLSVDASSWAVEGLRGRIPFDQTFAVEPPRFRREVAAARGLLGDDLEARLGELAERAAAARAQLDRRDILVDAPVTADYQALRPYGRPPAPDVVAQELRLGSTRLRDVVFEAEYGGGLLLVRRLAFAVWQGDVLLDAAVQLTPDRDLQARARGTATRINLDIPYAAVEGRAPNLDEGGRGPYTTSGVLDLRFALRDRQINGTADLERVTKKLLERAFGALELESARSALKWLELSERFGVRPTKGKIWISNNLLSAEFDWERLWIHVAYRSPAPWDILVDTFFIAGRLATVPTVGASIINIVNTAIRRFSIGNIIDRMVVESGLLDVLAPLDPYLASEPPDAESASR